MPPGLRGSILSPLLMCEYRPAKTCAHDAGDTILVEHASVRPRERNSPRMAGLRYSSECHYIVDTSMDKTVSAADANRRFSELLRTVKKGQSVVITSHGTPVAKISPIVEDNRAVD